MKSNYLAQYLLNENMIPQPQMERLLADIRGREVRLPLVAFRHRAVTPERLEVLPKGAPDDVFARAAVEQGDLTATQVENLMQEPRGESLHFAQCLLDEGLADYGRLAGYFRDYDALEERPVHHVVRALCTPAMDGRVGLYGEFMEIFMDSLMDFLQTPSVISPIPVPESELSALAGSHAASQCMDGSFCMVAGILAGQREFLELARRYSKEALPEIDELAMDSVEEFLNVINGIFSVQVAERRLELDLAVPRHGMGIVPRGTQPLAMHLCTDFGPVYAVLSSEEFI